MTTDKQPPLQSLSALIQRQEEGPALQIGSIKIAPGLYGAQFVWLEQDSGEGMDCPMADIEALLQAYYDENF